MKPSDNEMEIAIVAAEALLAAGEDEHHLAGTLLYLYQRQQDLEKVRAAAEDFLQSGQAEPQNAELVRAIESARRNES